MTDKRKGSLAGPDLDRRNFFGVVAAGAAAPLVAGHAAAAATTPTETAPGSAPPSAAHTEAETAAPLPHADATLVRRSGSDHMVDVLHALSLDYVSAMPGSTFRGLHESVINYGHNKQPELLTCVHEEVAVAFAHGYGKAAGKPMAAFVHGVVGLQHASMALYNAWADRAPVLVFVGNTEAIEERRPGVEWAHSAQDNAAMVRDYLKWDDQPASLPHFTESTVRAYSIATTAPCGPVLITADGVLQEMAIPDTPIPIPALNHASAPAGDPMAVREAAKMLAGASNPVIVVDRLVSTQGGMDNLIALAETLQAPVVDRHGRMNMPSRHPLNHSAGGKALVAKADVIIGLEVWDLYGLVNTYSDRIERSSGPATKPGTKLISITAAELLMRSNTQDFQRYQPVDLMITGDGETTLPILLEELRTALPGGKGPADRGDALRKSYAGSQRRMLHTATYGWDATPISVARLVATLGKTVEHEDWALVSASDFQSNWQYLLWDFKHPRQHIGGAGGAGIGYSTPASVGAALAQRDAGRIPIAILGDGDMMVAPGALWTAAHHRIPLLAVVHNNRAYHQELMHIQRMADRHGRGIGRAGIGTTIDNPNIDFAKLAGSMGVWSKGPITDPAQLAPALQEALLVVKSGQPAVVDVVAQGR